MSLLLVDVLAHEVFRRAGAEVLTGPVPQGRQVRWVHSTEVYEVAPLLRGGELLLTTGLGLAGSAEQDRRAYVRAVADAGLAALALELGWTFEAMPPDMLAEACDAGLPLVALHSRVPFAEITEAVNSSIVDRSIVRLRYADDLPLAIMRNWLPPALKDLTLEELTSTGLYAVLRARGIRPTVARQRIGARNATADERRTLHMSKAEPLVTMTRSAYAADGSPVEYGNHCYRADQYSVDVVVSER